MLWIAYVLVATLLDALTDVASDHVIATDEDEEDEDEDDVEVALPLGKKNGARLRHSKPPSAPQQRRSVAKWGCFRRRKQRPCQWLFESRAAAVVDASERPKSKLTSEQDLLCSCVAMAAVSFWLWQRSDWSILPPVGTLPREVVETWSPSFPAAPPQPTPSAAAYWLALVAGVLYAFGMRSIMKAWETVPSTIVTPMMQLSGPLVEIMEAALGFVARRRRRKRPGILAAVAGARLSARDWLAFALITLGGLAPSAESLPQLFRTWSPAMTRLLVSNGLYAAYFLLLALCVGDAGSRGGNGMDETHVVVLSNFSAVLTLAVLFAATPSLKAHARALRHVDTFPKLVSAAAEGTNYASMLFLSYAYERHYSTAMVTAARTALNQYTNVLLAAALYGLANVGRPVHHFRRKLLCSCVVSLGLLVSLDSSASS